MYFSRSIFSYRNDGINYSNNNVQAGNNNNNDLVPHGAESDAGVDLPEPGPDYPPPADEVPTLVLAESSFAKIYFSENTKTNIYIPSVYCRYIFRLAMVGGLKTLYVRTIVAS